MYDVFIEISQNVFCGDIWSYTDWLPSQLVNPTCIASDQANWLFAGSSWHEILLHFWRNKTPFQSHKGQNLSFILQQTHECLNPSTYSTHQSGEPNPEVQVCWWQCSHHIRIFLQWGYRNQVSSLLQTVKSGCRPALHGFWLKLVAVGAVLPPAVG